MTRKLWFQVGMGALLTLLIIKFFIEVKWIFAPLAILLKTIFLPLLFGGVLFYITEPLQRLLEKWKIPRWGSIVIIFALLAGGIWAAVSIIGPPIIEQVNVLIDNTPFIINEVNNFIPMVVAEAGGLPIWVKDAIENVLDSLNKIALNFGKWIVQFFQSIIQGTLILVLAPFFLLFMLKDHEKFVPFVTQFFTGERKKWVNKTLNDVDNVLSAYIRGQLLISTILATMLFIGYLIIGLNFALLLSVFALFMNVIPFIGPWIAFIPALLIAFFQDPMLLIWVSLVTLIAQQTDANLITPNVMGKTLDIHPLTIITVLFTAGKIAGFMGILLAIPAYAVGKAIAKNIYERRLDIKNAANKTI